MKHRCVGMIGNNKHKVYKGALIVGTGLSEIIYTYLYKCGRNSVIYLRKAFGCQRRSVSTSGVARRVRKARSLPVPKIYFNTWRHSSFVSFKYSPAQMFFSSREELLRKSPLDVGGTICSPFTEGSSACIQVGVIHGYADVDLTEPLGRTTFLLQPSLFTRAWDRYWSLSITVQRIRIGCVDHDSNPFPRVEYYRYGGLVNPRL